MKTEETKKLEQLLLARYFKNGSHIAFEVDLEQARFLTQSRAMMKTPPIVPDLPCPGIADAVQIDNHGHVTCFELKVTKSDFHSKAALSFIGNKNYYVMTKELYEKVKDEIPSGIGVLASGGYGLECVKPAKFMRMEYDVDAVLVCLVRSCHNHTTLTNIKKFAPELFEEAEREERAKTPKFNEKKHKFARLESGRIEPLYYPNGKQRNFYKDEDGLWVLDYDLYMGNMQIYMSEPIVEFFEEDPARESEEAK